MKLLPSDGCIHIISTIPLLKNDHFHAISPDIPSKLATDSSRKMTCNLDCDCAQKSGCISKIRIVLKKTKGRELDMTLIFQSKKSLL